MFDDFYNVRNNTIQTYINMHELDVSYSTR